MCHLALSFVVTVLLTSPALVNGLPTFILKLAMNVDSSENLMYEETLTLTLVLPMFPHISLT